MQIHDKLFIGGDWVAPATAETIGVVSPHTEEVFARVPAASVADVDAAVAAARRAFDDGPWPRMAPAERADVMARISQGIQARSGEFAETISREMGAPISWSLMGQVFSSTMVLDFYTGLARTYAFEALRDGVLGNKAIVRREPIGVAGAIVPWNVPLFVTMLKLGPALAAGATVVVKPAPETPLDSVLLAEVLTEAGLPKGVVNIVPAGREVGEHLVTHPDVDKIGFTGSTAAGRRIAALCGERLKRFTLELGGKSAAIILDDADLSQTIPGSHRRVAHEQRRGVRRADAHPRVASPVPRGRGRALRDGRAADASAIRWIRPSRSGRSSPSGSASASRATSSAGAPRARRSRSVADARRTCAAAGTSSRPSSPTSTTRMTIAREEIFGPVLAVIPYDAPDDAVRIANDSDYGLSGSVWTSDPAAGLAVARRVRTGTYTVNGLMLEFTCPFGGYKQSGMGRELGPEGLEAYLETKSISLPVGFVPEGV